MLSLHSGEFLGMDIKELMIPSERVAHVQVKNSLEHALLVLTRSGYSAIPVLDPEYKLQGLISTPLIMDAILGIERIEFEKLEQQPVENVMNKEIPRIQINANLKICTELLIDFPFLCVENSDGLFEGILTRRSLLVKLNNFLDK